MTFSSMAKKCTEVILNFLYTYIYRTQQFEVDQQYLVIIGMDSDQSNSNIIFAWRKILGKYAENI